MQAGSTKTRAEELARRIDTSSQFDPLTESEQDEIAAELRRLAGVEAERDQLQRKVSDQALQWLTLDAQATELMAERDELREHLQFIERWANHHGQKPHVTPAEALSVIQHYPPIKDITKSYSDGKVPETPDPWAELRRLAALEVELASTKKALALVQQHHVTAWNRGHEAGMRASRDTVKQATDALARDAWGNTQLTEALLAAEAERDRLAAEVEALRPNAERYLWLRNNALAMDTVADPDNLVQVWHGTDPALCATGRTLDAAIDAARKEQG